MNARWGLSEVDARNICFVLLKYQEVEEARIFGSRAKGTYKHGSDVDLCLNGRNLTLRTVAAIQEELNEETPMPYTFDVLLYKDIENNELRDHIDRIGKIVYKKESS